MLLAWIQIKNIYAASSPSEKCNYLGKVEFKGGFGGGSCLKVFELVYFSDRGVCVLYCYWNVIARFKNTEKTEQTLNNRNKLQRIVF